MQRIAFFILILLAGVASMAQNPVITSIFTADPAAMVYNDTVFLYTGHDEAEPNGTFYVMNNWHCFFTTNMVNWEPVGEVFNVNNVTWAKGDAWAGQVVHRNSKFYFYFCAEHKTITGKAVGVAVANSPFGPFTDIGAPLITNNNTTTVESTWDDIDPTVFIDSSGQAYMYWGNTQCYYIKLKNNMTEIDGNIVPVNLPQFTEAPFLHKHNGLYYLSYAYGWPEKIAYATSKSLTGPWVFGSVINNTVNNCGTNHQSIIFYKNQWYFIYHTGDIGGNYRRSVAVDYLFYNNKNNIIEIVQTPYGVQNTNITTACPPIPVSTLSIINQNPVTANRQLLLTVGDTIKIEAKANVAGTWLWQGPNNFTIADSVIVFNNITRNLSGTYFATFTNSCGTKSYTSVTLLVNYDIPKNIETGNTYIIEPLNSGKVISVQNYAQVNGSNIIQDTDAGQPAQRFLFNIVDSVYWKISPLNAPTRAVDVFNISANDGANIVIWDYWGGAGQQWQIAEVQPNLYSIISRNSQKCLDVNIIDNNIRQWSCNGADNQLFKITGAGLLVSNESFNTGVNIYPNPAKQNNLNFDAVNNNKLIKIDCYNNCGSLFDSISVNHTNKYVYKKKLQPGVYLFKILTTKGTVTKKVVVE